MVVIQFTKSVEGKKKVEYWEDVTPQDAPKIEESSTKESKTIEKAKKHRKHTPIVSEAQRRLFGAALGNSKKAPSISKKDAKKHLKEVKGKELPETVGDDFAAIKNQKFDIVYDDEMTPGEQEYIREEVNNVPRPGIREENLVPVADEDFAPRKKPTGHKEYTRMTPTGKVARVGAKGFVKPKPESKAEIVAPFIGMIRGGGEGTAYKTSKKVSIPQDYEEAYDVLDDANLLPNNPEKDIPKIISALKKGKSWVGDDVFGEGIIAFGHDKGEIKSKVREMFLEGSDEDFAARKEPAKHIRTRKGKPYFAGKGAKEEKGLPPKDSNWRGFAEKFNISVTTLDSFAGKMGFDNFKDLDISISPKALYERNPDKFAAALTNTTIENGKARNKSIERGDSKMNSYGLVIRTSNPKTLDAIAKSIEKMVRKASSQDTDFAAKKKGKKGLWGGRGPGMENCIEYYAAKSGFKPKTKGQSKEEAASALCATIGRMRGKIKSVKGLQMFKSYIESKYFDTPVKSQVMDMVKAYKAFKTAQNGLIEKAKKEPYGTKKKYTAAQKKVSKESKLMGTPGQKKALAKLEEGQKAAKKKGAKKATKAKAKKKKSMTTGGAGAGLIAPGMGTQNIPRKRKKKKSMTEGGAGAGLVAPGMGTQNIPRREKIKNRIKNRIRS